jgi:hypothetical protein
VSTRSGPWPHRPTAFLPELWSALAVLLRAAAGLLGFSLYAVLATFEPLVRLLLLLLALGGLVTCGIYGFLLRDAHFPLWTMLIFSTSMCVLSGLYSALLRRLAPG